MTQTELLKTIKASSGMQQRGDKIKAEAFLKVKDKLKPLRDSASFPLTLDGLHAAIKWKTEKVDAWKAGKELQPEQPKGVTLAQALRITDEDVKGWSTLKTSFRVSGVSRAQKFVDFFGANKRLDSITYLDLEKYRQHLLTVKIGRKQKKFSTSTINQYLICVSKIFTTCLKQGWIKEAPSLPYQDVTTDTSRRCFRYDIDENKNVMIDEEAEIYQWCEAWGSKYLELKMLIQLGVNTGMRKGEILLLQCNWVNFRNSAINLPAEVTKAKKNRTVTMNDTVKVIMRYFMNNRIGTQKVIKSHYPAFFARDRKSNGTHIWSANKICKYFNNIRDKMGLKSDPDFTFHSSRHTHITRLLEQGVPPHIVMDWVGHAKIETTMLYVTQRHDLIAGCATAISKHPATVRNNLPEASTNETIVDSNKKWKPSKVEGKQ